MKQKLLVIIPFIPYPLNTGGNQGSFHMLNYIKDFFDTHIWFHINNERKSMPLIKEFSTALDDKVTIHYTANKVGRNFVTARAIKRKFDSIFLAKDCQYLHNCRLWGEGVNGYADLQAIEDINNIIDDNHIDIIQIEYMDALDFVYAIPSSVKKVFVHHELGFVRKATLLEQVDKKYAYDKYCYNKQLAEEILALNRFNRIITMSDIDAKKLIDAGVSVPVTPSPSFIPQSSYPDFVEANNRLTYVASGGHSPNVEGLEWFILNIHPLLIREKPNYRLDVCGPKWNIQNLKVDIPSNVVFNGFVRDLRDVLPGSIMIVPILSGSGMRMKILESVNNAIPFVSTTVGAEGLMFKNENDCYITDDVKLFANDIIRLLDDKALQKKFVVKARELYDSNYSPEVQAKKRLQILNTL